MSLNISNAETCRLADELTRLTGETTTGAVTVALRERLERERRKRDASALAQELHAIGQRCAALLAPGPAAVEHGNCCMTSAGCPSDLWRSPSARTPAVGSRRIDTSAILAILFGEPDAPREETVDGRPALIRDERVPAARTARTLFLSTERELKEAVTCSPRWLAGCSGLPGL